MVDLDRTQTSFVRQKAKDIVEHQRTGVVTRVYEHQDVDDTSNFEVDVLVDGGTRKEATVPIATATSDSITVPKVGDTVVIEYREGEEKPPIVTGFAFTNEDRPPVGKAAMDRREVKSGGTPAGDGNLYITEYTSYEQNPAFLEKDELTPQDAYIQIAKRKNDVADPEDESDLPAKIEFYDSPEEGESHISVEINTVNGNNSTATWGIKFNIKTGEFKLLDSEGYGIESDGSGNFTWHHESIDFSESTTTSL